MSWRRILGHRFVAVPLAVALLVAGWNLYIAFNDGGIIEGEVRDRAGAPVPGATVIFFERNFVYYQENAAHHDRRARAPIASTACRSMSDSWRRAPAMAAIPNAGSCGSGSAPRMRRWLR